MKEGKKREDGGRRDLKEVWGGVEEALVVEEEWKELEVMEG